MADHHNRDEEYMQVPKGKYYKNMLYSGLFCLPIGALLMALATYTTVYQDAGRGFLQLCIKNVWLAPTIVFTVAFVLWMSKPRKRKEVTRQTNTQTRARAQQGKIGMVAVFIILVALLFGLVLAATVNTLIYPNTANVNAVTEIQGFVDGNLWANNTGIDWGAVDRNGIYTKNFAVYNNGNENITDGHLLLIITGIPAGWSETWGINDSLIELQPGQSVTDLLTLTVPFDAVPGPTNWTMALSVT